MSKLTASKFNNRTRGLISSKAKEPQDIKLVHKEVIQKNIFGKQKEKPNQLLGNANKLKNKARDSQQTKTVHGDVIQTKEMQKDLLEKTNDTVNKAKDSHEIIIVQEEASQKSSLEKENEKGLLDDFNNIIIGNAKVPQDIIIVHEEIPQKTTYEIQKEKQKELLDKVNKKTAEYQASKPSSGVFTEVVTHGAFTPKTMTKDTTKVENVTPTKSASSNGSRALLGFPSSANDLALDAKSDLESDPNISNEVKEKVIEKLFALVSMVQHVFESKVRVMMEYEKFKDTHLRNELRREKEHSEQLYKLNMNFQNEVIQSIQRLKSELDISRTVSRTIEDDNSSTIMKSSSVDFNTSDDAQDLDSIDKINSTDDVIEQIECLSDANEECKVNQQD